MPEHQIDTSEETSELVASNIGAEILASLDSRKDALSRIAAARSELAEAEDQLKRSEVRLGDQHKISQLFVLKQGVAPLQRYFYSQDYDHDRSSGWSFDEVVDVQPGEVITALNGTEVDYKEEVVLLDMQGDWSKSCHGDLSGSGTNVKSVVVIPFSRLNDVDIYEYYPNNPERTDAVVALLAAKLGIEQIVVVNGPLNDYRNVRAWQTR